jgi:hypothetical protein
VITRGVAETIVDGFEVIQVDQEDGGRMPMCRLFARDLLRVLEESPAIRQSGQGVDPRVILVTEFSPLLGHCKQDEWDCDGKQQGLRAQNR